MKPAGRTAPLPAGGDPCRGGTGVDPDIVIGLDDTDVIDSPGTNQLARKVAETLPDGYVADVVLRHQLLKDPRIPYTSQNGSASIGIRVNGAAADDADLVSLLAFLRSAIREFAPPGSDPGLALWRACFGREPSLDRIDRPRGRGLPAPVLAFGARCQREPVTQAEARSLAAAHGIYLEGLGGTEDGVMGALAALALRAAGDDGRVVHRRGWPWPDPFGGVRELREVLTRGIDEVRVAATGEVLRRGRIDVGKRLRPAFRGGRVVLFVEETVEAAGGGDGDDADGVAVWRGLKLP